MNAIILAAGMGTRLRPLTNEQPKCLVPVLGEPMIERQIHFLQEAGVSNIILISGYKADRLDYLTEVYHNVSIIYNDRFDSCNNIYSMYLAKEFFGDSYVVEGDVYLHTNCFKAGLDVSTYFAPYREKYENEWGLIVDNDNFLSDICPGSGSGYVMSGISYWTENDAQRIVDHLDSVISEGKYENLFWDNVVKDIQKELRVKVQRYDDLYEIDTVQELLQVEALLKKD